MAYARFIKEPGEARASDVYVFMHYRGWLQCHNCRLMYEDGTEGHHFQADSTATMTAHLREHAARRHHVPDYVVPEMEADDAENFPA